MRVTIKGKAEQIATLIWILTEGNQPEIKKDIKLVKVPKSWLRKMIP